MKKLMLLAITILFSFNSFSQTITLTEKQAKAVAIDLVKGKACAEELDMVNAQLELTQSKVIIKDKIIKNLEIQKSVFMQKDTIRINQIRTQETIIKDTETILKKSKANTTFWKVTTAVAVIVSGALLILK